jgi:hypothetical protein
MLDPFPPAPAWLQSAVTPLAEALQLSSLPSHIHEVIGAYVLYQTIESVISPWLSTLLFPNVYKKLPRRTRVNWDVHVVSLVQSCLINAMALWVMFTDEERHDMNHSAVERVYGYTSASGLIQAFATGYFVWDLIVSTRQFNIFGIGIWFHAVSALSVFAFGFVSDNTAWPRHILTDRLATIRQLLRTGIHSLRAVDSIPERALVLR